MGGGKGGGSSTTTQKVEPWSGQKPYLTDVFSEAQKNYNNGNLAPAYYGGTTIAPMDQATDTALRLQEQRALSGNAGMTAAQEELARTMSGQYLSNSPFTTSADNPFAGAANPFAGANNPFAGATSPISGASNPFAGADNPFMTTEGNQQLDAMVQRAVGQSNAGVNSGFASAGRYGSGAHAAAMNDAAGNIATQMYGQAYDNDMNRALESWNANQNRDFSAWNANQGRELSAWDSSQNRELNAWDANQNRDFSAWNANQTREQSSWNDIQNRALTAYNNERSNQIRGMISAPQLAQADYQDLSALSEVGTARENYAQEQINADINKYNYEAQRQLAALQNYANLVQGNYGNQSTSSVSGGRSNPLGNAASGALSGTGLALATGVNPWLGAGLGGLLGLL